MIAVDEHEYIHRHGFVPHYYLTSLRYKLPYDNSTRYHVYYTITFYFVVVCSYRTDYDYFRKGVNNIACTSSYQHVVHIYAS